MDIRVQGRVVDASTGCGIEGVAVSDGREVVVSGGDGGFTLRGHDEQEHVFVCVPARYRLPTDAQNRVTHHRPLDGSREILFRLQEEEEETSDPYEFMQVTDLHLGRGDGRARFLDEVIPAINGRGPTFLVVTGDIAFQESVGAEYPDYLARLRMPVFHVIGNHEMLIGRRDPKRLFKEMFGPTYYSFERGAFHFVCLDACTPAPHRPGWRNVVGYVPETQLEWLRQDLALLPPGRPVVAFIHIPIVSTHSERRGLGHKDEPAWEVVNDAEVLSVLATADVRCVLQGHMHENEHLHLSGTHFVETASISGAWWEGANTDGVPQGFRIGHVDGHDLWTTYAALEGRGDDAIGFVSPAAGDPVGPDGLAVRFNVFDGDPAATVVRCRIAGRAWVGCAPVTGDRIPHLWAARIRTGDLDEGPNALELSLATPRSQITRHAVIHVRDGHVTHATVQPA